MANKRGYARHERVAGTLRRELAVLIQRELKDPDLGFISVSDVEVSRDLGIAKVYVTVAAAEDSQLNIAILRRSAGYLRTLLGQQLRIRHIPELRFIYDESLETGTRMQDLLAKVVPIKHDEEE